MPAGADAERSDARAFRGLLTVIAAMAGIGIAATAVSTWSTWQRDAAIRAHRVRIAAHVVRMHLDDCGRSGCGLVVDYRYRVDGEWFVGRGKVRPSGGSDARLVREFGVVPVAYDTTRPASSSLNVHDGIFRRDPADDAEFTLALVSGVIVVIAAMIVVPTTWAYRARRRALASDLVHRID